MTGAHPEKCPEITHLAGLLGLGLSTETEKLLISTEEPIEEILAWIDACPVCSENLSTLDSWQDEVGYPDLAVVANERNRALELWEKLKDVPTEDLPDHVGDEHLFWAMSQLLQLKSREAVSFSAVRAVTLGEISCHLADLLPVERYTPRLLADLRARARGFLGNALRLAGRLRDSNRIFDDAVRLLDQGTGGALVRATVLDFLGSLYKYERRLSEAHDVLTAACALYEASGRQDMVGKMNLSLGDLENLRGNPEAAVALVTAAQEVIDPEETPALFIHCQHQLAYLLTEAGYFEEAELRTPLIRRFYEDGGDTANSIRVLWMEARIQAGLGEISSARTLFAEVASGLSAADQRTDLNALKLDLACLECRERNFIAVEKLAREVYAFFSQNGSTSYCNQALLLLCEAAREQTVTVEVIRALSAYLSNPAQHTSQPFQFESSALD